MSNWDKIEEHIALIKSANQKNLSELTAEQKQAVLYTCSLFPARFDASGKIVADMEAKEVALSPSYKEFNTLVKVAPRKIIGFGAKSCLVIVDEDIPDLPEVGLKEAYTLWPEDRMWKKVNKYVHLPLLKRNMLPKHPDPVKIAHGIAEANTRLVYNLDMPRNIEAIHMMMHLYPDTAKAIGNKLGMSGAVINLLNVSPPKDIQVNYESEGQQLTLRKFDLPRGTTDPEVLASGTYLAKYIALAMDNIFLKAE